MGVRRQPDGMSEANLQRSHPSGAHKCQGSRGKVHHEDVSSAAAHLVDKKHLMHFLHQVFFKLCAEALQRPLDLYNLECLDDIARLDIIVLVDTDTALHSGHDLFCVILAALER